MAGYSGTPLLKKLGIKPGDRIYVHQPPEEYFDWLSPLPEDTSVKSRASKELDFVHLFAKSQKALFKEFSYFKSRIKPTGMIWVSWPKKASKVPTDLDENIIRDYGLEQGLVDVKVCAVDEIWSGLKFMIRLKDR